MYCTRLEHSNRCRRCFSCEKEFHQRATEYEDATMQIDIEKFLKKGECLFCVQACPTGALVLRRSDKAKKEKVR